MSYIAAIGAAGSLFAGSAGGGGSSGAVSAPSGPVTFGSLTIGPKVNGKGNSATAATATDGSSANPAATSSGSQVLVWVAIGLSAFVLLFTLLPRRRAS